jgi:glycosyltransferase involved in cell wall biosynthesis
VASYPFSERSSGYLLFLGRIAPEKGVEYAIEIARRSGRELLIAGVVQAKAADYGKRILSMVDGRQVRYVGEAGPAEKRRLFGGADAFLFPIVWDEPFGLVVIESFACGTPVLAFAAGSAPELIRAGETGFLAEPGDDPLAEGAGVDRLAAATKLLDRLSRRRCREEAERRFSVERMVDDYERAYEAARSARPGGRTAGGSLETRAGPVIDDDLPGETRAVAIGE